MAFLLLQAVKVKFQTVKVSNSLFLRNLSLLLILNNIF